MRRRVRGGRNSVHWSEPVTDPSSCRQLGVLLMHPILAQLGPLTVLTHDAFTVVALALGLAIYYRELSVRGMLGGPIVWISLAAVLGGAIGARSSPRGSTSRSTTGSTSVRSRRSSSTAARASWGPSRAAGSPSR